jgi:hypothetical protein
MKNLYIVDYWVPFPSSEYGGMVIVIAESKQECHDLLLNWRDEYESGHDSRIMEKVEKAQVFELSSDRYVEESRIVDSFTT